MTGLLVDPEDTRFHPGAWEMYRAHSEPTASINAMAEADPARILEPAWFAVHDVTMDSTLAADLKAIRVPDR